ncbi:unnamed protein product [Gordionus sp. m RMFG-2023]|uniref:elongation factor Ts, mitochondrial-like n=1 Tax=Gordionus sp. m RMFG-2023 TaxID=3053472 RepID=UPI0030DEB517
MKLPLLYFRQLNSHFKNLSNIAYDTLPKRTELIKQNNSLLIKLRRSTGYPVLKCQQALKKFDYDYSKAKIYLDETAEHENWDKASKLQHRTTKQGLIGTIVSENGRLGLMVELNCETDFVTKNVKFCQLVDTIMNSVSIHISDEPNIGDSISINDKHAFSKFTINPDYLKDIPLTNSKLGEVVHQMTIKDSITQAIGTFGENITLRRAIGMRFLQNANDHSQKMDKDKISFVGNYCHSGFKQHHVSETISTGKYGSLVALTYVTHRDNDPNLQGFEKSEKSSPKLKRLAEELAQHVVGMNPTEIGNDANVKDVVDEFQSIKGLAGLDTETSHDTQGSLDSSPIPLNPQTTPLIDPESYCSELPQQQQHKDKLEEENEEGEYNDDEFDQKFYDDYYATLRADEKRQNEKRFLRQNFLSDPTRVVGDVLSDNLLEVVDFVRYECGEEI